MSLNIDIDKLLDKARSGYSRNEKGLAKQITSGKNISRPNEDEDFICYKDSHWETLTGIRGIPFGRIVQIAGRPDSGKSSHAMAFMKLAQDQNVLVILWDSENKFSAYRFENYFKGSCDNLLVVENRMIIDGGDQVERLVHAAKEQDPDVKILIVWDSVGGALAQNEDENSLRGGKQMAAAAKDNGNVCRAFVRLMERYKNKETNKENIAVLLINQVYANIGAPGQKESGGQKVEFHSSIIIQLTRKSDLNQIKNKIKYKKGIVARAKVKKNHLFEGSESVAELDIAVTAGGICLLSDMKTKKAKNDWDDPDDEEELIDE